MQSAEFEKLLRQQSNSVFFSYLKILIAGETLYDSNTQQRPFSLLEDINILLESVQQIQVTGKFSSSAIASALSNSHNQLLPSRKHGSARYRLRDFLFQLNESDIANIIIFCRKHRKDKRRKMNKRAVQGLSDYCLKKNNNINSHQLFIVPITMDRIKAQQYATYTLRNMSETEIVALRAEIQEEMQKGNAIIDESQVIEINSNDSDSPKMMRSSSSLRGSQLRKDQQESSKDSHDNGKDKRRNFNSNDNKNNINLNINNGPMRIGKKTIAIKLGGQDKRDEKHTPNNQKIIMLPTQNSQQVNQQQMPQEQSSLGTSKNPQNINAQTAGLFIAENYNTTSNQINLDQSQEQQENENGYQQNQEEQNYEKLNLMQYLEEDIESNPDYINSGPNDEPDDGKKIFEMLNQYCYVQGSPEKDLKESNIESREQNLHSANQEQIEPYLNKELEDQEKKNQYYEEDNSRRSVNNNIEDEDDIDLLSHILKKQQEYLIKLFYANDLAEKQPLIPPQQRQILKRQNIFSDNLFDELEGSLETIINQKIESTESNNNCHGREQYQQQDLQNKKKRQYDQSYQRQLNLFDDNNIQQQPDTQHFDFQEINKQLSSIQLNTLNQEQHEDQDQQQFNQNNNNQNSYLWDRLLTLLSLEYNLSSDELVALLDTLSWDTQLLSSYLQQPQSNFGNN